MQNPGAKGTVSLRPQCITKKTVRMKPFAAFRGIMNDSGFMPDEVCVQENLLTYNSII